MPPRDPRLCPALDRALPGDSGGHAGYRPDANAPWDFLFGDGQWHRVSVRAWWLDRLDRQVVLIEWHAAGSTWSETYLASAEKMREVG